MNWKIVLFASCTLFGQDLLDLHSRLNVNFVPPSQTTAAKALLEQGNAKIDPMLRRLTVDSGTKSLGDIASEAKALEIPTDGNLVSVVLTADSESNAGLLRQRIAAAGGRVSLTIDDAILARIPPSAIETLGAEPHTEYLAPQGLLQEPPQTVGATAGAALNQGVLLTKANLLHKRGLHGDGVKVGIIDFGFTGYKALQQSGKVPEPAAVKAFGKDGGWDRGNRGTVHGAACAEIIHAMAPGAALYIASIGDGGGSAGDDEIGLAAEWLASQKVDIISFSGGGHAGPHNGGALLDGLVAQETAKGILWVNAAGNEGESHWATKTQLDPKHFVIVNDKSFLLVQAASDTLIVQVTWDDWGPKPLTPASTQDFDAYLLARDAAGNFNLVNASENPQNGRGAPREVVGAKTQKGQIFALFISAKNVNRSVRMHVHLMTPGLLVPHTAVGSIGIPATSPKALAVGAVDVHSAALEPYSSQGPTDDDRAKPEVAGPDKVDSAAYKGAFAGTSAACPHVAGFAALLKQADRTANPEKLSRVILAATSPLANNRGAGRGLIDGSKVGASAGTQSRPGTLPFPVSFGGPVSTGKLDALVERAAEFDAPLGAKVVVGRPVYHFGDGMKIGFKADEDCYYLLVHRSSSGEYTLIAPRESDDPKLEGGRKYALPEGDAVIKVTPPAGTEHMILICSREPVVLSELDTSNGKVAITVAEYKVEE